MLFFDSNLKPFKLKDEEGNYIIPGGKKIKDIMKEAPKSFVDFINKCLKWNPFERITPSKALLHPFIIENMKGDQLYKHKIKVKHIMYGMNYMNNNYNYNINSTRDKEYYLNSKNNQSQYQLNYNINNNYNKYIKEVGKYRGNSCQTKRVNNNINNMNNFNINNYEVIKYMNTQGGENDEIKKVHKKQSYSVTYGNNISNKYCYMLNKKKKEKNLPLSTEVDENSRRINITENNENGYGYKRLSKYKKNNNKMKKHLPKKKSLGRFKNYDNKKPKK
jgi:serine/threonine protein kinase